ncbi:MAG TPA: hypothetical protein VK096_03780 [Actinomycetales bacterium]|nr:hypothetical protein [Actinomycetales bacterium]
MTNYSPVILGGDYGAYSLARAFHEQYGVRSTVVSKMGAGAVGHSKIIDPVVMGASIADEQQLLNRVLELGKNAAGDRAPRLLFGSADWLVRFIVRNRDKLSRYFTIPYVGLDVMDRVVKKRDFTALCENLGIPHPKTVVHRVGEDDPQAPVALAFPVVAKPGDSAAYNAVNFPGKHKVFVIPTPQRLAEVLTLVRDSGYRGDFIVQERIPGPDSNLRMLTLYIDQAGRTTLVAMGQALLEDHSPTALGNPVAILTGAADKTAVAHAERMLRDVGWRGYANFDMKYHPGRDEYQFLEVNPRLGRTHHYITLAGQNPAEVYVADYLENQAFEPVFANEQRLYSTVPRGLIRKYVTDTELLGRTNEVIRKHGMSNPISYLPTEWDPRRIFYVQAALFNQRRKFKRFFPTEPRA